MKIFDPVYAFKNIGLLMLAASSGGGNTVQRSHARSTDMAPAPHNPATLNNLAAEHFLPVTSRAAHRASSAAKNTFTSAKSTSKSAKRASRSAKNASTSTKPASTSAATISTSTTTVRHSDCEVHSAVHNLTRESADPINPKVDGPTRKSYVAKIAAKLTPFSGINEIDALLLPKINWPTSLNLKYCMYIGNNTQVIDLVKNGVSSLYQEYSLPTLDTIDTLDYQAPTAQAQTAIHEAVTALNKNTPFQFSQVANENEADIIFINSNLTNLNAYGLTYGDADDFLSNLYRSFTSKRDLEEQIEAFNRKNAKKVIVLFDNLILNSTRQANDTVLQKGDLYHNTVLHELLHTIGLTDQLEPCYERYFGYLPVGRKELSCQSPNQYAKENTIMIRSAYPLLTQPSPQELETTQYPQSLQPFDYGAVNFIAENIACEQSNHTQRLTEDIQQTNPLSGDTTYRFTSNRWVEILDRRCQALNQATVRNDESSGDSEGSGDYSEVTIPNCETRGQSVHLGDGHIQLTWVDSSGIDIYDFSAFNTDVEVDLRPGQATTFNKAALAKASNRYQTQIQAKGNLYQPLMPTHADDYLIENIKTGSGDDVVYGNQADNYFDLGSSPNMDDVTGDAGRDTFHISAKTGNLYIRDFQAGENGDKLSFDPSFKIDSLAALRARATQETAGKEVYLSIELDKERIVGLKDVIADELHSDNLMISKRPT